MALDKPGPGFRPEQNNGGVTQRTPGAGPPQYAPGAGGMLAPPGQTVVEEENPEDKFLVNELKTMKNVRPVFDLHIDELLHYLVENDATDLHIAAGIPPVARMIGELRPMPYEVLQPSDSQRMMYDILTDENIQAFESKWELDFAYALGKRARFRVNIFKDKGNVAAALRLIPTKIPTLQSMGFPPVLEKLTHLKRGLVLVTGPTGSGKSTTLAAMIDSINSNRAEHILTIEDPIEYVHPHKMSVVNQRELSQDTRAFSNALRAALREDPDVILVGEMRDLETMQLAISAAETGHLVFATLHTNSAASTVDRIVDGFPDGAKGQVRLQLSNNIQAVICQTLIPKADGEGRIGVQEIMIATPAVRNLIREAKAHQLPSIIQTSMNVGMITMDQNLRDHYLRGQISYENAMSRALNPEELKRMLSSSDGTATGSGRPGQQ
jgi:twitching motility protein PilT